MGLGLGFCGSVGAVGAVGSVRSVRGDDGETESRGALFEFLGILFIYRLVLLVLGYRSWFEKGKEKGDQIRRKRGEEKEKREGKKNVPLCISRVRIRLWWRLGSSSRIGLCVLRVWRGPDKGVALERGKEEMK